jgi:hypothetical protein
VATPSAQAITWTESTPGHDPSLVSASLRWGTTRGTIYAPYTGTALSLLALPAELQPPGTPQLVQMSCLGAEGATYRDLVPTMDEIRGTEIFGSMPPFKSSYWRTAYPYGTE